MVLGSFFGSDMENTSTDTVITKVSDEAAEGKRDLRNAFFICVIAVIIFRSFVIEPFKIPSASMVPTLQKGDHIFVSKFDYGLSIPFTKVLLAEWSSPKRGEVIVFLYPKDEAIHYIKRVVGVPGDKVVVSGRGIFINGEEVKRSQLGSVTSLENLYGVDNLTGEIFREQLGSADHLVRYTHLMGSDVRGEREWEIPAGNFFVMGDNRDDSYDSREWGFVPRENIKGRARIVWLSLDMDRAWGKMEKVRWARTFMGIK